MSVYLSLCVCVFVCVTVCVLYVRLFSNKGSCYNAQQRPLMTLGPKLAHRRNNRNWKKFGRANENASPEPGDKLATFAVSLRRNPAAEQLPVAAIAASAYHEPPATSSTRRAAESSER